MKLFSSASPTAGALAREARRSLVVVALALGLGAISGAFALFMAAALTALLAWHVMHLYWLSRWMRARRSEPRCLDRHGIWAEVFESLRGMQRVNRKRKKRVNKLLTRFLQAASASPDGAVVVREDGNILWSSPAANALLGLRHPGDKHQPIANLLRNPAFARYLEQAEFEEPLELTSPVERDVTLSVRIVPYGRDRRLIIARDVTRMKHLERTHKDFVANVSHELRTPLTVIAGYLEGLEEEQALPGHWRRPVRQMMQQSARMCAIVEDLLKLSGLESNAQAAVWKEVGPADMLNSIAADARNLSADCHDITVEGSAGARVLGDYNELYSAVSNLVFNAVQYTPEGGRIVLRWRVAEPASSDEGARIEIADTGVGIEAHHLPRLTERFYRADKARSRELGGTGLGLAIVKHVLARHGAVLEVESTVGEGSTFSCVFPPERVKAASRESSLSNEASAAASG